MYKLVVLLSVVALAAAKPSVVASVAPLAYSAAVPAVSSVSQYSSSVVHGAPVVGPAVYSAPSVVAPAYARSVVPAVAPAVVSAVSPAVVGAVAQAPNSPAIVLDAVNGVPLDTPEVVAARAAHYQTRALAAHGIHKRSVGVAPVAYSSVVAPVVSAYSTPVVSAAPVVSAPVVSSYATPVAYSAVVPRAYSVHPW
ncbi:cuticle protein 18.7-like [Galleria mellonella]|uniref:Cuticle protein 18.7-like n=1 Tax=Galleria mellonella TaxID=7137 RepID=A0A6J3C896_GALME|nr:cuticle protein 18.7-like [Galleria mellonella]